MPSPNGVPKYDELIQPTLTALHSLGGSGSNGEIAGRSIVSMGLPAHVVAVPHGKTRLTEMEYRLQWARSYLKIYGLLENSERGVWSLTATGLATKKIDPQEIVQFVRAKYHGKSANLGPPVEEAVGGIQRGAGFAGLAGDAA